jgi:hypothetical protein
VAAMASEGYGGDGGADHERACNASAALTRISEAGRSAWPRAKVECRRSLDVFGAEPDERGSRAGAGSSERLPLSLGKPAGRPRLISLQGVYRSAESTAASPATTGLVCPRRRWRSY